MCGNSFYSGAPLQSIPSTKCYQRLASPPHILSRTRNPDSKDICVTKETARSTERMICRSAFGRTRIPLLLFQTLWCHLAGCKITGCTRKLRVNKFSVRLSYPLERQTMLLDDKSQKQTKNNSINLKKVYV